MKFLISPTSLIYIKQYNITFNIKKKKKREKKRKKKSFFIPMLCEFHFLCKLQIYYQRVMCFDDF